MNEGIFYQSTVRGVASAKGDALYFGFVERVKRDVMTDPAKTDTHMRGSMAKVDKFIASLPDNLEALQPWERFEVYDTEADMNTGDILVMWRIPVQEKKAKS